jgi:hypothetical protein
VLLGVALAAALLSAIEAVEQRQVRIEGMSPNEYYNTPRQRVAGIGLVAGALLMLLSLVVCVLWIMRR